MPVSLMTNVIYGKLVMYGSFQQWLEGKSRRGGTYIQVLPPLLVVMAFEL